MRLSTGVLALSALLTMAGCGYQPVGPTAKAPVAKPAKQTLSGACVGGDVYAQEVLTPASIPSLSQTDIAQIINALHESAHTDVTTIQEAFQRVDGHEINRITIQYVAPFANQFYTEIEYGAGDNSYGAYFYWGTSAMAAAIHDGYQEECGPVVYQYDRNDFSPECEGILNYLNYVTQVGLEVYLPRYVAENIVAARAVHPFNSIASVTAVNGVGEVRLQQIVSRVRSIDWIDQSCEGVHDEVALSQAQAAKLVAFVNEANREELRGTLSFLINEAVVDALIAARPIANATAVGNVYGVGPATYFALRNAAIKYRPWEQLVDAVNTYAASHPDGRTLIDLHFDWRTILTETDRVTSMNCFGINPALLPPIATTRPTLANSNEIQEAIGEAVHLVPFVPYPGEADYDARAGNHLFFGCNIAYQPNPWVYDYKAFYVDTVNGQGLLIDQHYVE